MRFSFLVLLFFTSQALFSQNEASAKRTEMIAERINATPFDSFTMQSFELSCFENEAPGEIKVFYTNKTIQKVIYTYELSLGVGEVTYYFFKNQLNYVDHARYKFDFFPEQDSIDFSSKNLESRHQMYFNGNEQVFEKQTKLLKMKEAKHTDYQFYAKEIKNAAEERIRIMSRE